MISTEVFEPRYSFDIGRPNLITDNDFVICGAIHDYIKGVPTKILVNSMFYQIDEYIQNKKQYIGGGMSYTFWFPSEESKSEFEKFIKKEV